MSVVVVSFVAAPGAVVGASIAVVGASVAVVGSTVAVVGATVPGVGPTVAVVGSSVPDVASPDVPVPVVASSNVPVAIVAPPVVASPVVPAAVVPALCRLPSVVPYGGVLSVVVSGGVISVVVSASRRFLASVVVSVVSASPSSFLASPRRRVPRGAFHNNHASPVVPRVASPVVHSAVPGIVLPSARRVGRAVVRTANLVTRVHCGVISPARSTVCVGWTVPSVVSRKLRRVSLLRRVHAVLGEMPGTAALEALAFRTLVLFVSWFTALVTRGFGTVPRQMPDLAAHVTRPVARHGALRAVLREVPVLATGVTRSLFTAPPCASHRALPREVSWPD